MFSGPAELTETIDEALSPAFNSETVGRRLHRAGVKKLSGDQQAILSTLESGEELINLTPCFDNGGYEGIAIHTSRRVIEFKRKVRRAIRIDEIADLELSVRPNGTISLTVVSNDAAPYSPMKFTEGKASLKYWSNVIVFPMSEDKTVRHFAALLRGSMERRFE